MEVKLEFTKKDLDLFIRKAFNLKETDKLEVVIIEEVKSKLEETIEIIKESEKKVVEDMIEEPVFIDKKTFFEQTTRKEKDKVYESIKNGKMFFTDIKDDSKVAIHRIGKILEDLVIEGKIVRTSNGKYELPKKINEEDLSDNEKYVVKAIREGFNTEVAIKDELGLPLPFIKAIVEKFIRVGLVKINNGNILEVLQ